MVFEAGLRNITKTMSDANAASRNLEKVDAIPERMRAWLLDSISSLEALRLVDDATVPIPGEGEVLLRIRFAALNPADRYVAEGAYPAKPKLPHVLGRDGVGQVVAVGARAQGHPIGSVRAIVRGETGVSEWGTFAEYVAVKAESLIDVPRDWSLEQAAGATLVYLTAHQAICQWSDLPKRCTTLITGASGGVGVASVQLARAMGHRVIAISRDENKRQALKQFGADEVIDPTHPEWWKRPEVGKVDLAIDNVGGSGFGDVIASLGMNGRVSCVGRLAGVVPQFNTASLFFRRIRIGGVAVGTYTRDEARRAWAEVLRLMDTTGASPLVDSTWSFEKLPEAFARLARGPMGKVVLEVGGAW